MAVHCLVAGGADMSCLPIDLLCHCLPVVSLRGPRDTAVSKANPSYMVDFMVHLVRLHE